MKDFSAMIGDHALLVSVVAFTVMNVIAAIANVRAFAAYRRRMRRVVAREGRLDAGPVTGAVQAYIDQPEELRRSVIARN